MSKKIKIFIATHKEVVLPDKEGYIPLQVGAEGKKDLGYERDNVKENISLKNKNYCELTGVYWIWKNVKCDITGLVHYRRYFFEKSIKHKLKDIISEEKISSLLKEYDVIVPKKVKIPYKNVKNQFCKFHHEKDYDITRAVIKKLYPDYLDAFDKVSNRNWLYPYNMLITKKSWFDEYSKWLFNILFEVEKRVDMTNYSDYEQRLYGFLSERLLNVWLEKHNNLKTKELYVYNIQVSYLKQRIIEIIKNIFIH